MKIPERREALRLHQRREERHPFRGVAVKHLWQYRENGGEALKKYVNRWSVGVLILILSSASIASEDVMVQAAGKAGPMDLKNRIVFVLLLALMIFFPIALFTRIQQIFLRKGFFLFHSKDADEAASLLLDAEALMSSFHKSVHLDLYLENWDELIRTLQKLSQMESRIRFPNFQPSQELSKLLLQEQRYLRDAISRSAERTKSDMKSGNRFAFESFCRRIGDAHHRFDPETERFALQIRNEMIDYRRIASTTADIDAMDGSRL